MVWRSGKGDRRMSDTTIKELEKRLIKKKSFRNGILFTRFIQITFIIAIVYFTIGYIRYILPLFGYNTASMFFTDYALYKSITLTVLYLIGVEFLLKYGRLLKVDGGWKNET